MFIARSPNVAKISMQIKGLANAKKQAIRKAFYDIGKDLVADAKEEISKTPKHGREYIRHYGQKGRLKRPRTYTASAPGEAPAVVTGKLRDSVNFTVTGSNQMTFGVDESRRHVDYGKYLEYGNLISMTGKGSKNIAPRPFISAAYKKNMGNIARRFENAINVVINK